MSALDQAFIKAYAKEPSPTNAAASGGPETGRAPTRASETPGPAAHARIENLYAAGTLYRIETPQAAQPEPLPPPHFASCGSRRLPLRYRLAQMDLEEVAPPPLKRTTPTVIQPALNTEPPPAATRRAKAHVPPPPELPPDPALQIEELEEIEELQEVVVEPPPTPATSIFLPGANSVEVSASWDELVAGCAVAESTLVVWPRQEDLAGSQASSLISLDLDLPIPRLPLEEDETLDAPEVDVPETVTSVIVEMVKEAAPPSEAKSYRLDAAHASAPVPPPHQPPQPTVEDLIKPASEPEEKFHDRPVVISEAEAAELVGAAPVHEPAAEKAEKVAPLPAASRSLVPAWEVDRFLWPALCEKLLQDDHSYFSQAGGKIAAAVRDGLKSLAITGSRRGEGRTTLALCLARSAARAGLKVALVDADFARPQLAASLGLDVAASWHEAALGKSPLSEAAIKSVEDNLTVLPLDVSTVSTPLSLADPRLTKTLREATSAFDLLVLDLGPTAAGDEPLFPENEPPPADAAIVVRDLRYCTPSESQAVGERLNLSGIEAVGIAENFVPQEKSVA